MSQNTEDGEEAPETVKVYIRIRPLNKKEVQQNLKSVVHLDTKENLITLAKPHRRFEKPEKARTFKFDYIFNDAATQTEVYKCVALPVVDKVLKGYNGTILAYGQTGTGKTYTMTGHQKRDNLKGIIPNTFSHIFGQIAGTSNRTFLVTVTYVEIYNEEIRDLITKSNEKLEIREIPTVGVYIRNLRGCPVNSVEAMIDLMKTGNKNRITRSTMMNDVSSRSHAIFSIRIEMKDKATNQSITGKLNLVDLAGSERIIKTQATGERLREASSINQSLSVLGNVISALVEGKNSHIPYRNSKLTRLLQDSLGGNSKTSMIAMISPSELDYDESLCTLRFVSRVKYIKNYTQVNIDKIRLIESFENEIEALNKRLAEIKLLEEKLLKLQPKKKHKKEKVITDEMKAEIQRQNEAIAETEREKEKLLEKITRIQERILVGGENLYLKAKEQEFLLQSSEAEIKHLDETHRQLEEKLLRTGAERLNVEEKYSSLQDENFGVTAKIQKVQQLLQMAKDRYDDKEEEYQREYEELTEQNRNLNKQISLNKKIIDRTVPKEYQEKIEKNCFMGEETNDIQLRGVAYAGNNIRRIKHLLNKSDCTTKMKLPYRHYMKLEKDFRENFCMVPRYPDKNPDTPPGTPPRTACKPKGVNIRTGRPYYTLPIREPPPSPTTFQRLKATLDEAHRIMKNKL